MKMKMPSAQYSQQRIEIIKFKPLLHNEAIDARSPYHQTRQWIYWREHVSRIILYNSPGSVHKIRLCCLFALLHVKCFTYLQTITVGTCVNFTTCCNNSLFVSRIIILIVIIYINNSYKR